MNLYERVSCHDRMRNRFRPDIPGDGKTQATAGRMSDLSRSLKSALACRDKDDIDKYMTYLGKALVDIKNTINSKPARKAFDYEKSITFPERRPLKTVQRKTAKAAR